MLQVKHVILFWYYEIIMYNGKIIERGIVVVPAVGEMGMNRME